MLCLWLSPFFLFNQVPIACPSPCPTGSSKPRTVFCAYIVHLCNVRVNRYSMLFTYKTDIQFWNALLSSIAPRFYDLLYVSENTMCPRTPNDIGNGIGDLEVITFFTASAQYQNFIEFNFFFPTYILLPFSCVPLVSLCMYLIILQVETVSEKLMKKKTLYSTLGVGWAKYNQGLGWGCKEELKGGRLSLLSIVKCYRFLQTITPLNTCHYLFIY